MKLFVVTATASACVKSILFVHDSFTFEIDFASGHTYTPLEFPNGTVKLWKPDNPDTDDKFTTVFVAVKLIIIFARFTVEELKSPNRSTRPYDE
jgi:hypothetical protein